VSLVVGFDIDMTLVDSRPGIRKSLSALSAQTGVFIDVDLVVGRLGQKLEDELAEWYGRDGVDEIARQYRAFYYDFCVDGGTLAFAGARESVQAVRARNGRVLAITAKTEPLSQRCLEEVGIDVDGIVGHVHGDEKRDALIAERATIYVGDTIADVRAGVDAGILTVGVATGMHNARQLSEAGATVAMESLEEFPAWLAST
jgi:phosphoglycolate phosphatase